MNVTHVALRVGDLPEAEAYYRDLFGLDVAFREAETKDGWVTLPPALSWEEAPVEPGLVMLYRDGFRLALEQVDDVAGSGTLSHVGLQLDDLQPVRTKVDPVTDRENALVFDDRYGVRWELNTFAYDDPPALSTGARTGRWLEVGS